jgi:hypothetical protein
MRACTTVLLLAFATQAVGQDESWQVTGFVLDSNGHPVTHADVAPYWSANGWQPGETKKLLEGDRLRELWSREGQMSVSVDARATTEAAGEFSIKLDQDDYKLLVMDQSRQHGAVVVRDLKRPQLPLNVMLRPLIRVHGMIRIQGTAEPPEWTHTYVSLPQNPFFPLGKDRVAGCGSFESRFEFRLPPGRYVLHAYNDPQTAQTALDLEITLTDGQSEMDVGIVELVPRTSFSAFKEQSKARGSWGDYTQHYGRRPPEWHVVDARGVSKQVQLSDFRGKWVLLYFWGPECSPCLKNGLPTLSAFYELHSAQREKFELLSFCLDYSGEVKSMDDVDRILAPVIKHVWGGKGLPFPVLLDNTFTTYERFGLESMASALLIDPEGNLVRGDHTTLAERLK